MSMSRKHYQMIANIVRAGHDIGARNSLSIVERCASAETLDYVARQLAHTFAQDNPDFDRARFMRACGIGTEG